MPWVPVLFQRPLPPATPAFLKDLSYLLDALLQLSIAFMKQAFQKAV